jgi:prephenate dehydrogenase
LPGAGCQTRLELSTDSDFRRIAIVGVGLIGGSMAFAVRRTFPDATVVGVDRDDVVVAARQLGAVTQASTSLEGVRGADLVVLAAPVEANLSVLSALPDLVSPTALVTDTGSTKRAIVAAAAKLPALTFVGGHPLAGAARGGIEASRVDLFERRPWVLTPTAATSRAQVDRLSAFVRALGAQPLELDAAEHDRLLAMTSHLPQLTASALMHVVGDAVGSAGLALSGGGLADTTRVAASPARIWTDICATNTDQLLPALDRLIETLTRVRTDLSAGRSIEPLLESGKRWREKLR